MLRLGRGQEAAMQEDILPGFPILIIVPGERGSTNCGFLGDLSLIMKFRAPFIPAYRRVLIQVHQKLAEDPAERLLRGTK
jgi:hypothetical protein